MLRIPKRPRLEARQFPDIANISPPPVTKPVPMRRSERLRVTRRTSGLLVVEDDDDDDDDGGDDDGIERVSMRRTRIR